MIKIEKVRCEYLINPIGIDVEEPRITRCLSADDFNSNGLYQKSFQIYFSINRFDDILDKSSGVIESTSMNYIFKQEFKSRDLIRYQIEIIDNYGRKIKSNINTFEYGILDKNLFKAKWIKRLFESFKIWSCKRKFKLFRLVVSKQSDFQSLRRTKRNEV